MANPLKQIPADSVGIVTPQRFSFDKPLTLRSGRTIDRYDLMVETYGTLNADRSNAVLLCHCDVTSPASKTCTFKSDLMEGTC